MHADRTIELLEPILENVGTKNWIIEGMQYRKMKADVRLEEEYIQTMFPTKWYNDIKLT